MIIYWAKTVFFVQNSAESHYLLVETKNQIPLAATNNKQPLEYWGILHSIEIINSCEQ